ncbi:4Fe-4S dicluster domain-containing protein [Lewinella sp. W8]|uniref:4Fe-4S dicluster domain-containing protein n=1 Tax=Lewinella sp. W8 TaxID=2528208 RepID=UPI00106835F3|nr:4Fe-4S dicluster domain-containing protein [Lewinella sp. W8]MTB51835.1 4Fe-4S binding protein [Lewinella sp. W8]
MQAVGDEKGTYRDSIATVGDDGKRQWIYPKKPNGRFYRWRTWVSWGLLAILFGLPFIKMGGEPLVLLNVLERRFILFGLHFTPQDFHLFAILMITAVVFIILFTVIWGRLFCGWVCPQTIFMEMVFRKVEYWIEGDANAQRRLNKAPWNAEKILKKGGKQLIFILISALIAHTFWSYLIGVERVQEIVTGGPRENFGLFTAIVAFIGVFYFVFSYMREQVCIAVCPYGRLQGVLLDNNSVAVMYDWVRGEPRGKLKRQKKKKPAATPKKEKECSNCANCRDGKDGCHDDVLNKMASALTQLEGTAAPKATAPAATPMKVAANQEIMTLEEPKPLGDCIDCNLCVQVCPTGIDIRNGTQLECINCTACIDACDEVMDKIKRPRGLIRYDSHTGVEQKETKLWSPRVMAYSAVLVALIGLNIFLLTGREAVDAVLLRTPGLLYQKNEDGTLNNLYTFQLLNKTTGDLPIEFRLQDRPDGRVRLVGEPPIAKPQQVLEGALFIDLPPTKGAGAKVKVRVEVWSGDEKLDVLKTNFIQPIN